MSDFVQVTIIRKLIVGVNIVMAARLSFLLFTFVWKKKWERTLASTGLKLVTHVAFSWSLLFIRMIFLVDIKGRQLFKCKSAFKQTHRQTLRVILLVFLASSCSNYQREACGITQEMHCRQTDSGCNGFAMKYLRCCMGSKAAAVRKEGSSGQ